MRSWWEAMKFACLEWQTESFGEVEFVSQARKLAREAKELEYASGPDQLEELADCRLVLMALEAKSGFSEDEIRAATEFKLAKCRRRKWRRLDDGTWQHVKENETT